MKATMDEHGGITVIAETPVEAFALKQYSGDKHTLTLDWESFKNGSETTEG